MSEFVHTLMGRGIRVQFKFLVQVDSSVHLVKLECVQSSVRFIPFSELQSAEQLFKSVNGMFQSVVGPYVRITFACTRVVIGVV